MNKRTLQLLTMLLVFAILSSLSGSISLLPNDVAEAAAGISIIQTSITTGEDGTSATFDVVLTEQPNGLVILQVFGGDATEGTITEPANFLYDSTNWDVPQTVTVTGVDDTDRDGDITYVLTVRSTPFGFPNADPAYQQPGVEDTIMVTNVDDDVPGITVTPAAITTSEDGTAASFDVVLNALPLGDVTVTITGLDSSEGSLSTSSLTFTTGNWNVAQTVTVTGVDDAVVDGDVVYMLTATTSSAADADYDAGLTGTVTVSNTDNDVDVALVANFTAAATELAVDFTDTSTGGPNMWDWDFGDSNTSTMQNPTHTYDAEGTYTVCLTVGDGVDTDTACQDVTVSETPLPPPPPPGEQLTPPHLGLIKISTSQAQPTYFSSQGYIARYSNGNEIWLPHDYDGNGYDTYIVTGCEVGVNDDVFVEIFLGSSEYTFVNVTGGPGVDIVTIFADGFESGDCSAWARGQ